MYIETLKIYLELNTYYKGLFNYDKKYTLLLHDEMLFTK